MKYKISNENKWTTLAAYATNGLFYPYLTNFDFRNGRFYPRCVNWVNRTFIAKGLYPESEQPKILNCVEITVDPDYKHISPEAWNDITNDFSNLDEQQMQDEIINAMQESIHNYYFGDTKKQEQELYRAVRRSLADMYNYGYHDGKQQLDRDYGAVQGKFDWILESVMKYMRAVINNKK